MSLFDGMYAVTKIYISKAHDGKIKYISRTFGKIAIVADEYVSRIENYQEIWVSRIIKELKPGKSQGSFIIEPVKKIEPTEMLKLIPGFYTVQDYGKAAVIQPNENSEKFWILSAHTRQLFSSKYCAYVVPCKLQGFQ